jgi:aryl-alcohol dehydrogenase-like predicted oxidoreductase
MVSEIGLGTRAWGGSQYPNNYGSVDDRHLKITFSRALGAGCRIIDTADVFGRGHSETLIGSITNCRKDIVIVTKGGQNFYNRALDPMSVPALEAQMGRALADCSPDEGLPIIHGENFSEAYLRFAIEQSWRRLRKESIPVYLLDNPSITEIRAGHIFDLLDRFKAEGGCQYYGIAVTEPEAGLTAVKAGRPDVIQLTYNLLDCEPARLELLDLAAEKKIGVMVREPLANGLLTGKFQGDEIFPAEDIRAAFARDDFLRRVEAVRQLDFLVKPGRSLTQAAIRFALNHPAVSTVIVGCKTPDQAIENFGASQTEPLSQAELALIHKVVLA